MSIDFDALSAMDAAHLVKAGEVSAREMADAAFSNIEKRDGKVKAFLELSHDLAYEAADKIDQARSAGEELPLLAGVPVAFKDNMNLVGTHTTCASKMLEGYESTYTASCVENILNAGGLPLGKLNLDEFAFGSSTETSAFQTTHNPHDLERVPGGSSGGSAASVAAGEALLTLGSDTGGSIRQPAAFCGVVGFKPTYGMVSRYGVVAFASSLDQVGPFAKTVDDVAHAMQVLARKDPKDVTSQPGENDFLSHLHDGIEGKTIGIVRSMIEAKGVTDEVRYALNEAIQHLEDLGANLVDVELPHAESAMSAYYIIGPSEAFSNLSRFDAVRYGKRVMAANLNDTTALSRYEGFGPEVRRRILLGSYILSSEKYQELYYPAQKIRTLITKDYTEAFKTCDTLFMPCAPRAAFKFGEISDPTEMYLSDMFTVSINIAGNGGISVPLGMGKDTGLPLAGQLVCPAFKDAELLRVAHALEGCYEKVSVAQAVQEGE
ncbi:MAG: Asp-tRNA(Asn)/Glu-tRNA(Gln) amidotransferase subunit GatA [Coriobacteriia bacterium]|nr:Asp-tRNA(Asn)/Glu-tRNA(Gln) amidotransferase subunit GatA [Coriobacteriia bacterium]